MQRKITRREFLASVGVAAASSSILKRAVPLTDDSLLLWYDKPATEWTEALPIGNGRLGAMIFGGPATEQIQLNEDTLYAGSPYDPNNREALQALPEDRRYARARTEAQLAGDMSVDLAREQASSRRRDLHWTNNGRADHSRSV